MSRRAKFAYLLLQLGAGINSGETREVVKSAMRDSGARIGISIWSWPVYEEARHRSWPRHRIFFNTPSENRDDEFAMKISEGIFLLCELFYGPLFELSNSYFAFPFRSAKYLRNSGIEFSTLRREIEATIQTNEMSFLDCMIQSYMGIPDDVVALAIKSVPTLLNNNTLSHAVAFLSQAQHDFYVYPGQLQDALHDGNWIPTRVSELARWESAYQNSYKAVEAIIGDPPRDENRFCCRLREAGLNPEEEVGYRHKESIKNVIRQMNRIRDTHVAHGSTPNRGIRLYQMVEFQECTRYVLQTTLEKEYGAQLY